MLNPRWRKVARDLWNNKSRTILVIASIAIGIFAFGGLFVAQIILLDDLERQYRETLPSDITFNLSPFDDDLVRWLVRQPGIIDVQPKVFYPVELVINGSAQPATLIAYHDFENQRVNLVNPETGIFPPGLEEILVERSFDEWLGNGINVGDTLILRTPDGKDHPLTFTGTVHDLQLQPGRINPVTPVYVSQRTLLRVGLPDAYNQIDIRLNRAVSGDPTAYAESLREELQRRGIIVQSTSINIDSAHWSFDIISGLSTVLIFAGLASLLLSAFLVVNTISGIMAAQKKQIGIMKIIGASRPQIITIYMVMIGILGLIAFVIAFPLSIAMGMGLLNYFSGFLNYNPPAARIPLIIVALEFTVALFVPLLSAVQPVFSGTRITPAEAISDYNSGGGNNLFDVFLASLSGLPRPALISIRNTFRRKIRLLVTVATLTLAGAFFISIMNVRLGLLGDVEELLRMANYDIQYRLSQPVDINGLERRVLSFNGIDAVESWVSTSVIYERPNRSQSQNYTLIGLEPNSIFVDPVLDAGRWLDDFTLQSRYDIVISSSITDNEPTLQVGETITLKQGADEEEFRVVGIVASDFENIYGHFNTVMNYRGTVNLSDQLLLRVSPALPNTLHSPLSDSIIDYLDDRGVEIVSTTLKIDIVEGVTGGFNVLIYLLLGMAILIALVAGLGLTGTMSLNVMERTREIGVMRAVGAGNNAIRLMFVGEGVLIGILSVIFSLPLSYPSTVIFANVLGDVLFGDPLTILVNPWGILIWLVIILLVSSGASTAPANRASQISIREAIAYE